MNNIIKHIIITRFNLPHKNWVKNRYGKTLNDDWLDNRYNLFKDYCLPSVIGQTNKNFEWWLFFDTKTPKKFKTINESLKNKHSNIKIFYEASLESFWDNLAKQVEKHFKASDFDILITTRLDNDDVISVNFINDIQKKVKLEDKPYLLTFPIGYTLQINNEEALRTINYEKNSFISLIEFQKQNILTVYKNAHDQWKDVEYRIINNNPSWVQVIHENNLLNFGRGKLTFPFYLYKNFKIKRPSFHIMFYLKIIANRLKSH